MAFPDYEHLVHSLLERLDPLAYCRGRDVQSFGRGVKRSLLDHSSGGGCCR
jgi:hypothetical protein